MESGKSEVFEKDLVRVRPGVKSDFNFILSTWLNGLYYGNDWFNLIDKQVFMANHHKVIETILNKTFTTIRIACDSNDQDTIFGYAVLDGSHVLHWVFVKPAFRGFGLAKELVPGDIHTVTHLTKVGRSIKPSHVRFNPYLI